MVINRGHGGSYLRYFVGTVLQIIDLNHEPRQGENPSAGELERFQIPTARATSQLGPV